MARPSSATTVATTPGGIRFQWDSVGYKSKGARDANLEVIHALVSWADSAAFCREIVGFTTWRDKAPTLQRSLPLECPLRAGLFCEDYDLIDFGAYETRSDLVDDTGDAFVYDWCLYQLTFTRPRWWVRSDRALLDQYDGSERNRYVSKRHRYSPRERKVPGYVFETVEATPVVVDEVGFLPDYQIEHVVTWHQVPYGAVPEDRIAAQLLTCNLTDWEIEKGKPPIPAEELLFKGPQSEFEWYQGADGAFYVDLTYVFARQPGGWNAGRKNDGTRKRLRVRGSNTPDNPNGKPPYQSSNFSLLFTPGPG